MNKNGLILHEDKLRVVIATGFARKSRNIKTEDMIQVYIIRRDVNPVEANKTGQDIAICGRCPLRGHNGEERICYEQLKNSPLAIFRAYKRGSYRRLKSFSVFTGRYVRFGAYGDPAFMPLSLIRQIASACLRWTGYTHQWGNPLFLPYRDYLMASVETPQLALYARSLGFRPFRTIASASTPLLPFEMLCVHFTHGITCKRCGLCNGNATEAMAIANPVHGNGKKHFIQGSFTK